MRARIRAVDSFALELAVERSEAYAEPAWDDYIQAVARAHQASKRPPVAPQTVAETTFRRLVEQGLGEGELGQRAHQIAYLEFSARVSRADSVTERNEVARTVGFSNYVAAIDHFERIAGSDTEQAMEVLRANTSYAGDGRPPDTGVGYLSLAAALRTRDLICEIAGVPGESVQIAFVNNRLLPRTYCWNGRSLVVVSHGDKSGEAGGVLASWAQYVHELGHAIYYQWIDPSLPFGLRRPPGRIVSEFVAERFVDLIHHQAWLGDVYQVGHVAAAKIRQHRSERIARRAKWQCIRAQFERERYRRELSVDAADAYWTGLLVSAGISTKIPWTTFSHFREDPGAQQCYLIAEMLRQQWAQASGDIGNDVEEQVHELAGLCRIGARRAQLHSGWRRG